MGAGAAARAVLDAGDEEGRIMKERRGTCSTCEVEHAVTASGKVGQHKRPESWPVSGGQHRVSWIPCEGTGQPPSAYAADPIADAEARGFQRAIDALRDERRWLAFCVANDHALYDEDHLLAAQYLESLRHDRGRI